MANKKERKQLKIEALANNIITKSEAKKLKKAGVSNSQIKKLKEQAKDKRQELRPIRQAVPEGELRDAVTEVIADGKLGKKDLKKLVDKGLSIEQVKDVASQASNTSSLKVGKSIQNPGQVEKLAINREIENNPNATLPKTPDGGSGGDDDETSFGGGSHKPLVPKQEEEDMGFDRVDFYADKDDNRIGYEIDPDTGIAYSTFTKKGQPRHYLQIGNIPGTRIPDGSPQMHVKIVDYDASIESYDKTKLGIFEEVEIDGEKRQRLQIPKPKRRKDLLINDKLKEDGTMIEGIRRQDRQDDYDERGILNGGMVKKYKTMKDGQIVYSDVKKDDYGNLKPQSFISKGQYQSREFNYPTELDESDSFLNKLSIDYGNRSPGGGSSRDLYIQSGRALLNSM